MPKFSTSFSFCTKKICTPLVKDKIFPHLQQIFKIRAWKKKVPNCLRLTAILPLSTLSPPYTTTTKTHTVTGKGGSEFYEIHLQRQRTEYRLQ